MTYYSFQNKAGRASLTKYADRDEAIAIRAIRGQSFKEIGAVYNLTSEACGVIFRRVYHSRFPDDKMRISLKKLRMRADEIVSKILKS